MTIKDFGAQVESVWQDLRPVTKKILVGALRRETNLPKPSRKISYDAHADWEVSRLLSVLDEQTDIPEVRTNLTKMRELKQFGDVCANVLEAKTESAEVFIQLARRALLYYDYNKFEALADVLASRFIIVEIAEIIRQTNLAQIRAVAYETLALKPANTVAALLNDPLYFEIALNALEQQMVEYGSEEARAILEQVDFSEEINER